MMRCRSRRRESTRSGRLPLERQDRQHLLRISGAPTTESEPCRSEAPGRFSRAIRADMARLAALICRRSVRAFGVWRPSADRQLCVGAFSVHERSAHDEIAGNPPCRALVERRLQCGRQRRHGLEAELLVERAVPRDVAKGDQRDRRQPLSGGPGENLVDERTSDATTAVCRCHRQFVEVAFAVDHPRHCKSNDGAEVVDRHPGALLDRRPRQALGPVGLIVRGAARCADRRSRGTAGGPRRRPLASTPHHRQSLCAPRSASSRGPSTPCAQIARCERSRPAAARTHNVRQSFGRDRGREVALLAAVMARARTRFGGGTIADASHQRSPELVALMFRRDADRGYETADERR